MARRVVGELLAGSFRVDINIETIFRDIDADGDLGCDRGYALAHLFLSHACHPGRLNTRLSVRAARKRRGRSNSSSVRYDRHDPDPSPFTIGGGPPADGEPFSSTTRGQQKTNRKA